MATLTDAQRAFLRENAFPATVTTLRPDGSPHSTVVWIDEVDGEVWFNTAAGRAKERHLRNDARASALVIDPANQYRWIAVWDRPRFRRRARPRTSTSSRRSTSARTATRGTAATSSASSSGCAPM